MKGTSLAGMSLTRERVDNDFYATPTESVEAILDKEFLYFNILEPACGEGHISSVLKKYYPTANIVSTDLVEREDKFNCNIQSGIDFLTHQYDQEFDTVITNPPFSLKKHWKSLKSKFLCFVKYNFLKVKSERKCLKTLHLKEFMCFLKGKILYETAVHWTKTARNGRVQCASLGLFGKRDIQANLLSGGYK